MFQQPGSNCAFDINVNDLTIPSGLEFVSVSEGLKVLFLLPFQLVPFWDKKVSFKINSFLKIGSETSFIRLVEVPSDKPS